MLNKEKNLLRTLKAPFEKNMIRKHRAGSKHLRTLENSVAPSLLISATAMSSCTTTALNDAPLLHHKRTKVKYQPKRRAATPAELDKLLKATVAGGVSFGLSGEDRYMLYLTATETGLRAGELATLTPSSFHLGGDPPYVYLPSANTKNGKETYQPIGRPFARLLVKWLMDKPADERIWPGAWWIKGAKMLRGDLDAAGVKFATKDGTLDFHGLRVTYISGLAHAGVSLQAARELARHSDVNLTARVHTRFKMKELAQVLP